VGGLNGFVETSVDSVSNPSAFAIKCICRSFSPYSVVAMYHTHETHKACTCCLCHPATPLSRGRDCPLMHAPLHPQDSPPEPTTLSAHLLVTRPIHRLRWLSPVDHRYGVWWGWSLSSMREGQSERGTSTSHRFLCILFT